MRCGSAQADITPDSGCEMCGFVARTQPSIGIHDHLSARALFLEKEGRRVLWLHADIVAFERDDVLLLKRRLFARFGLHEHEIIVTATHTHSGPPTVRLLECGEYDAEYVRRLLSTLEMLAGEALRTTETVTPFVGEGTCALGIDRRGFAPGHTDSRLPVIGFRRKGGSYLAILASYAVHGVAMGSANRYISGDILGRAARTISGSLPGSPTVVLANGACGNINPPGEGEDFDRMEGWADTVAASAVEALAAGLSAPDTIQGSRIAAVAGNPQRLTEDEIDASVAGALGGNEKFLRAKARWKEALLSDEPDIRRRVEAPFDVHVISLCGVTFAGFGGEIFSAIAPILGSFTYPVSYANGDAGYICPSDIYEQGGYEPHVACLFYGTNPLREGVFEAAADIARQMTADLAAAKRPEED